MAPSSMYWMGRFAQLLFEDVGDIGPPSRGSGWLCIPVTVLSESGDTFL